MLRPSTTLEPVLRQAHGNELVAGTQQVYTYSHREMGKIAKSDAYTLQSTKSKEVVCRINRGTKTGAYFLIKAARQRDYVDRISLSGFTSLPSGLRRDGNGLPSSGYLLLRHLSETLGKFELIIDGSAASSLDGKRAVLNHDDLRSLLRTMRTIKAQRFREINGTVESFLHSHFPAKFGEPEDTDVEYRPNAIAEILKKQQALDKLSKDDVEALGGLFPEFIKKYGTAGSGKKKLFILSDSKKATEVVYIEKIVADFERKLTAKNQTEQSWQEFLRNYILLFNSNYATVLEKENIALLGTKFPDFLLIDAYSYLDIYEIKKPSTNLLKKDKSRGNYYWDVELAKAISQVENYIANADRHGASLCDEIRKHRKLEVRVIKPRGFIIAGMRSQLTDEIMEDNFRLLNNSLKNLSIILFDELLDNLKNFLSKLKTD
jgi:hypothetical protein